MRFRMFLATLGMAVLTGCSSTTTTAATPPAPVPTTASSSSEKKVVNFDAQLTALGFTRGHQEDGGTAWLSADFSPTSGVKVVVGQAKVSLISFQTADSIAVNCRQTDDITPDNLGQRIDFFRPKDGILQSGCVLEA